MKALVVFFTATLFASMYIAAAQSTSSESRVSGYSSVGSSASGATPLPATPLPPTPPPSTTGSSAVTISVSSENVTEVPPTPEPTFITSHSNETALKLTYFFVALIIFLVPAILACFVFFTRHQRRLAAVRALQEAKSKTTKEEGNKNVAEGTGSTSALNSSVNISGSGQFDASGQKKDSAKQPTEKVPVFKIYDVSHTPPEKNLLEPHDIYGKPPFREDMAVLNDVELGAKSNAGAALTVDGGEEDRGAPAASKIAGGFGAKSTNLLGAGDDDDGFGGGSSENVGGGGKSFVGKSFARSKSNVKSSSGFGNSSMMEGDDENPLVANEESTIEEPEEKGWGKKKGKRKAEW